MYIESYVESDIKRFKLIYCFGKDIVAINIKRLQTFLVYALMIFHFITFTALRRFKLTSIFFFKMPLKFGLKVCTLIFSVNIFLHAVCQVIIYLSY